jgi:hypothetical protein
MPTDLLPWILNLHIFPLRVFLCHDWQKKSGIMLLYQAWRKKMEKFILHTEIEDADFCQGTHYNKLHCYT